MSASPKPPISEVLRHYYGVVLRDRGGWQKILCPLHPEENPSASANTEKQRWSCFVCDVSEDIYDVIMREEGIGFRKAQEWAYSRFGGGCEGLPQPVPRQPGREVHGRPRAGGSSEPVRNRIRRFGENGT
ncbi:CHC2 zinc finger domain-containing protein [Kitasatospora sp. NPDC004723]|uniref:CHC2 zinc finger domain-containing protein n=1 Tax=Kitasatospora sp. NPDC004723 TaxID=3154288 RepID=UPI0033AB86FC